MRGWIRNMHQKGQKRYTKFWLEYPREGTSTGTLDIKTGDIMMDTED